MRSQSNRNGIQVHQAGWENIVQDQGARIVAVDRVNTFMDIITAQVESHDSEVDIRSPFFITAVEVDWFGLSRHIGEPVITTSGEDDALAAHDRIFERLSALMATECPLGTAKLVS
jgi:hypothetical protein